MVYIYESDPPNKANPRARCPCYCTTQVSIDIAASTIHYWEQQQQTAVRRDSKSDDPNHYLLPASASLLLKDLIQLHKPEGMS